MPAQTLPTDLDLEHDPVTRVTALARFVLGDEMQVDMFLHRKQRDLGGLRPVELAGSQAGARQVETLLWAIHADRRL
jgi:uncharacterized protein (DUF2384 family)